MLPKDKSTSYHRWLVYGEVIIGLEDGSEHRRGMNTLLTTEKNVLIREDIAKAQQAIRMRFSMETQQIEGSTMLDIPIVSISYLGQSTENEFHGVFAAPKPVADPFADARPIKQ